jgi:hypothetical protein
MTPSSSIPPDRSTFVTVMALALSLLHQPKRRVPTPTKKSNLDDTTSGCRLDSLLQAGHRGRAAGIGETDMGAVGSISSCNVTRHFCYWLFL